MQLAGAAITNFDKQQGFSHRQPVAPPSSRLPVAKAWELEQACLQLNDEQARLALAKRVLPFVIMPGKTLYVAAGHIGFVTAKQNNLEVVATTHPDNMLAALQKVFGPQILRNARYHLATGKPWLSASRRFSGFQTVALILALVTYGFFAWQYPQGTLLSTSAGFSVIFLCVVGMRLAAVIGVEKQQTGTGHFLPDEDLPTYTILVPLFRETNVIDQLLHGLARLNYRVDKLDIKLILEETDHQTQNHLSRYDLPPWFEVIVVPHAMPQTKPKALNYALQFARGDLAVIFDAEDIPEPDQLLKAATAFHHAPSDLVCLQASLTYYNAKENWLTRQFTIEYAVLFDLVLPFLGALRLPLPLGGTSNHFRISALRKMGAWDPFNVTEDADLGLRLARFGWRADILPSATFEEANNNLPNWISQRARWIKGWIQTWFVHMRNPFLLVSQIGISGFVSTQIIVAGIVLSTLAHPFFLGLVVWQIFTGSFLPLQQSWPVTLLSGVGLAVLLCGYAIMMIAGRRALKLRRLTGLANGVFTMPFYWLLMSLGGWLAVYQFIVEPFHWNKTRHGLSKFSPPRYRQ